MRAGVHRRRDREAEAQAGRQQRAKHRRCVARVHADPGQPHQAGRGQQHAGGDQRLGAEPGQQHHVGQVGGHHHHRDQRQEGGAADHRGVAQGLLHVVGEEQEDAEHARAGGQHGQVGAASVAVEHHPGRQQRAGRAGLPEREHGEQRHARRQEAVGGRRVPVVGGRVGEPVDQAEHRGRDERDAGQVQPGPGAGALLLEQQHRSGAGEACEDQVHVQAPAPGQVLGQDPAEHQADRAAGAHDRAVDAERLAALLRIAERRGQDRQGRRREKRAERALEGPRRDQHAEAGGRAAGGRRGGEAECADQERDLAADQVAEPSAEKEQAAERERVGGHHPLPVHGGEAQRPLRGRQRDIDDRGVQHDHELGEADGAQDQPPAAVGGCAGPRGAQVGRGGGVHGFLHGWGAAAARRPLSRVPA